MKDTMEKVRMRTEERGESYLIGIGINGFWRSREFFVRCTSLLRKKIKREEKKLRLAKSLLAAKIPYIASLGKRESSGQYHEL